MDIKTGKGRKFVKEGSIYNYVTTWSNIVLGRVLHDPDTNKYRAEKMDREINNFVMVSSNHRDHYTAAKSLVSAIG